MSAARVRARRAKQKPVTAVKAWYRIENKASAAAEVFIYDEIGGWGVTAADFVKELQDITASRIDLHLNTPGGEVFDGIAIYNALRNHKAQVTAYVDGLAASAGSFIAQAGDRRVMARQSQMMIHDGHAVCVGNAKDMATTAALLDKCSDNLASIYAERAGGSVADWRNVMRTETWYSAQEAVDAGLADEVASVSGPVVDDWDLSIFNFSGRPPAAVAEEPTPPAKTVKRTVFHKNADGTVARYDPNQPRGDDGKWGSGLHVSEIDGLDALTSEEYQDAYPGEDNNFDIGTTGMVLVTDDNGDAHLRLDASSGNTQVLVPDLDPDSMRELAASVTKIMSIDVDESDNADPVEGIGDDLVDFDISTGVLVGIARDGNIWLGFQASDGSGWSSVDLTPDDADILQAALDQAADDLEEEFDYDGGTVANKVTGVRVLAKTTEPAATPEPESSPFADVPVFDARVFRDAITSSVELPFDPDLFRAAMTVAANNAPAPPDLTQPAPAPAEPPFTLDPTTFVHALKEAKL